MAIFSDLPLELRQIIYSHALTLDLRDLQATFFDDQPLIPLGNGVLEKVDKCIGGKRIISAERVCALQYGCAEFAAKPKIGIRREDAVYFSGVTRTSGIVELMQDLRVENVVLDFRGSLQWFVEVDKVLRRFLRKIKKGGMKLKELVVFLCDCGDLSSMHLGILLGRNVEARADVVRETEAKVGLFLTYSEGLGATVWHCDREMEIRRETLL